jgi:uncharacterized protein (DUF433 family)
MLPFIPIHNVSLFYTCLLKDLIITIIHKFHKGTNKMKTLDRITFDPNVMGGKPCIRGIRVTVGTLVGLLASGHTKEEILKLYPYLEEEDIDQALSYAAWRAEKIEIPLTL